MKAPKPAAPPKPIAIPKETSEDVQRKKKLQLQKIQSRSGAASTDYTGRGGVSQKMGG